MKTPRNEPTCCSQVIGSTWAQEHYETESHDARPRALALRRAGFRVSVTALGEQVTSLGRVRITMLTIKNNDGGPLNIDALPSVKVVR